MYTYLCVYAQCVLCVRVYNSVCVPVYHSCSPLVACQEASGSQIHVAKPQGKASGRTITIRVGSLTAPHTQRTNTHLHVDALCFLLVQGGMGLHVTIILPFHYYIHMYSGISLRCHANCTPACVAQGYARTYVCRLCCLSVCAGHPEIHLRCS